MRKLVGIATALAAAGVLLTPAANATTQGVMATCPSGAFCLQEPNGTIYSRNIWYAYGAHNLSGVIGFKYPVNNQTGGAGFTLCRDPNGGRCNNPSRVTGMYALYDFTPINSIVLVP
ncbi:hypothetical protein OG474_15155 [Kribbella sp. NBC_01505]|uniref:hypothetical protein n=1 Tax=Kribbella sp. NBC_01505 TaxID=2903580 RepID=UPI0038687090